MKRKGVPAGALNTLSANLTRHNSNATPANLQAELLSLATNWASFSESVRKEYPVQICIEDKEDDEQTEEEWDVVNKNCRACVYFYLQRLNMLTLSYHLIGLGYKFLLTLSVTQVAFERSFSTLKFIKNRLRSTASQEHLESFMLMAMEKETLHLWIRTASSTWWRREVLL